MAPHLLFGLLALCVATRSLLLAAARNAPLDCLWLDLLSAGMGLFPACIRSET